MLGRFFATQTPPFFSAKSMSKQTAPPSRFVTRCATVRERPRGAARSRRRRFRFRHRFRHRFPRTQNPTRRSLHHRIQIRTAWRVPPCAVSVFVSQAGQWKHARVAPRLRLASSPFDPQVSDPKTTSRRAAGAIVPVGKRARLVPRLAPATRAEPFQRSAPSAGVPSRRKTCPTGTNRRVAPSQVTAWRAHGGATGTLKHPRSMFGCCGRGKNEFSTFDFPFPFPDPCKRPRFTVTSLRRSWNATASVAVKRSASRTRPHSRDATLTRHTLEVGFLRSVSNTNTMNAHGVLGAKPVVAGAQRVGRRSMAGVKSQSVGVNQFFGNARSLKARASLGRRVAQPMGLNVRAEKVVGIDLGTTNSAVRTRTATLPWEPGARACRRFSQSRRLNPAHRVSMRARSESPKAQPQGQSQARHADAMPRVLWEHRTARLPKSPADKGHPPPPHARVFIHPHAADVPSRIDNTPPLILTNAR